MYSKSKILFFLFSTILFYHLLSCKSTQVRCVKCKVKIQGYLGEDKQKIIHYYGQDTIINNTKYKKFFIHFFDKTKKNKNCNSNISYIRIDKEKKKVFYRYSDKEYSNLSIMYPTVKQEQLLFNYNNIGDSSFVFLPWLTGKIKYVEKKVYNNDTTYLFSCYDTNHLSHATLVSYIGFNVKKGITLLTIKSYISDTCVFK